MKVVSFIFYFLLLAKRSSIKKLQSAIYQGRRSKMSVCSSRKRKEPDLQIERDEEGRESLPPIKEIMENIFLKDLEEPWRYFNEGVFK